MKTAVVLAGLLMALTISAQEFQQAPDNPAFLKYQQERIQKAAAVKTVSGHGLGYVPSPVDFSHLKGRTPAGLRVLKALPSSYDLRTQGKLTPIKDQDPYGTCWAFATYSSLESTLMPTEERYFSVNNMANNHGFDYDYDDGGDAVMSTAYLTRWSGPINEADDPYANGPGHSPANLAVQKHVQEVLFLPLKASALDNTTIKQAVMDYGAMYVSFYIANAYYDSSHASYYFNGTTNANHAVAIVGWDDDYPAVNFKQTPPGNGAFIVRNSWGTAWGEQGYFYCSYYDAIMGYDENAAFNNAEATFKYSAVYQYDPLGRVGDSGCRSTNAWGANIFTATNNEILRAVGFYATDVDVNYNIYIYGNVTSNSPTNGTLLLSQTGGFTYPGYHTVVLGAPVDVASGQLFSVVIKFINSTYTYPVAVEYAKADYSSRATSLPGQSYVSPNGISWIDLVTLDPPANVCIKAYAGADFVEGDFDGDRLADPYWPVKSGVMGMWTIWRTSAGYAPVGPLNTPLSGGEPCRVADFEGDGLADLVMVNYSNGANGYNYNWYIWLSSLGYPAPQGPSFTFTMSVPSSSVNWLAADFDGDRLADPVMVVHENWYIWMSKSGYPTPQGPSFTIPMPDGSDRLAADFDGDRLADPALVVNGNWYFYMSKGGYAQSLPLYMPGTDAMTGDFDRDGLADPVMVTDNNWTFWFSSGGYHPWGPYAIVP